MARKIHIAGFPVRVGNRKRQRCAWCGEVLMDYDLANVLVAPGSRDPEPAHFELGALVAVDGPGSWIVPHADGDRMPAGWCGSKLSLVKESN